MEVLDPEYREAEKHFELYRRMSLRYVFLMKRSIRLLGKASKVSAGDRLSSQPIFVN